MRPSASYVAGDIITAAELDDVPGESYQHIYGHSIKWTVAGLVEIKINAVIGSRCQHQATRLVRAALQAIEAEARLINAEPS